MPPYVGQCVCLCEGCARLAFTVLGVGLQPPAATFFSGQVVPTAPWACLLWRGRSCFCHVGCPGRGHPIPARAFLYSAAL